MEDKVTIETAETEDTLKLVPGAARLGVIVDLDSRRPLGGSRKPVQSLRTSSGTHVPQAHWRASTGSPRASEDNLETTAYRVVPGSLVQFQSWGEIVGAGMALAGLFLLFWAWGKQ